MGSWARNQRDVEECYAPQDDGVGAGERRVEGRAVVGALGAGVEAAQPRAAITEAGGQPPGICFEERPAGKTYNINKLVLGRPYESD